MTEPADGVRQDEERKPEDCQDKDVEEGGVIVVVQNFSFQLRLNPAVYVELYDPEQGDEEEVEGDEEAEGPPHVGDALLLSGLEGLHAGGGRGAVDGVAPPCAAAAPAVHHRLEEEEEEEEGHPRRKRRVSGG